MLNQIEICGRVLHIKIGTTHYYLNIRHPGKLRVHSLAHMTKCKFLDLVSHRVFSTDKVLAFAASTGLEI